jgi:GTP-binding protein Era
MTTVCGTIAIVGAPNAGKSTLVNALVGQKVAIVSAKVQTTRTRLIGIAIEGEAQLLLIDTPGIFSPRRRLDRAMVKAAWDGAHGADVIAMVIDSARGLGDEPRAIIAALTDRPEPKLLILNKVDITAKPRLLGIAAEANGLCPFAETHFIAASSGDGVPALKSALAARLPQGPWHYPEDQLSDATSRLMASEITREQIYRQLHAELPYASTIDTEKWEERRDGSVAIHQQILVERASQRAIVLGKGGERIREIGAAARERIAELLGRPVHLFLHVKVKEGWSEERSFYRDTGLDWDA